MRTAFLGLVGLGMLAACDDGTTTSASSSVTGTADATSTAASTSGATTSSSGTGGGGGAPLQSVTIAFGAEVGGEVFGCAKSFPAVGTAPSDIAITDFRFYVHDVRLIGPNDAETPVVLDQDGLWQVQDLALLDFEDKTGSCSNGTAETNAVVKGKVPPGIYEGIAFRLGVPAALDHLDAGAAPSPLNLSALFWSWTSGYKYARVDSNVMGGAPFLFHLGATGCTKDPMTDVVTCAQPNIPSIRLPAFDLATQKIVLDVGDLFAASDLSTDAGGAPGCMSGGTDPECVTIFPRLGLDIATGLPSATDPQALFHVE